MKRAGQRHQPRLITEMSETPLLDLVFVLLFVFMVAAPLLQSESQTDIAVTAAEPTETDDTDGPPETVSLEVSKDLTMTLEGKPLSRVELPEALERLVMDEPQVGVVVRMEKSLPVELLVELMGELEASGVAQTAVASVAEPISSK